MPPICGRSLPRFCTRAGSVSGGLDIPPPTLQPAPVPSPTPAHPGLPPAGRLGVGRRLWLEMRNVALCIVLAAVMLAGGVVAVIVMTGVLTRLAHL